VTDANVVLGFLNPSYLAGGSVRLDAERARAAIDEQVARPLGIGLREAAWTAHMVANVSMIGAIQAVSTQRGRDPREFALVAFGGSGPVHAATMARMLEISRVIVPPAPGLFSAYGLLFADHEHHAVQTYFRPFETLDLADLAARLQSMKREVLAELALDGYPPERVRLTWAADMRYVGQGFELTVPMDADEPVPGTIRQLEAAFNEEHERTYGHRSDGAPVQFVNLRLTALGLRDQRDDDGRQHDVAGWWASRPADSRDVERPTRQAYFGEVGGQAGPIWTPVIRRSDLAPAPRHGPVIVEEYDATTVVPPGCTARLDPIGNIIVEIGG
jgi:N-methylhydantoinase A